MQKWYFLFFILISTKYVVAEKLPLYKTREDTVITKGKIDTSSKVENKVIDEVIAAKQPLKNEKVIYLSQVTKYGFKDLFKNYSYNSSIPYSSQVNPHAESYMEDYLKSHQDYLLKLKKTGVPYFNFIDGILVKYGLPKELKYLAVIESDLKPDALSPVGALGPWQFMPYTAKDYGLIVNSQEDDRTDYFKSTNAAAKYLLYLYKNLKDWLLVIAAYNGGPGRVYTAIKKSNSRNFWQLQYYLPEESRNHVKKFIATHYIMETGGSNETLADSKFNYSSLSDSDSIVVKPQLTADEKKDLDSTKVSGRYMAAIIAKNISMDAKDFDRYNPDFDNTLATGSTYNMQLPRDKMKKFVDKKYEIINESVNQLLGSVKMNSKNEQDTISSKNPKK